MTTAHQLRHCSRCGHRLAADNQHAMCSACQAASRDAQLQPPAVPPEFWQLDQMADALATWHMGRVIYAYRNHPHHSQVLSQELVGSWLGLTQAQLSRIENGRAPEELTKLIRFAQILGIPAELLWFDLPGTPRARASTTPPPPALMLPVLVDGRVVAVPVDRDAAEICGVDDVVRELATDTGEGGDQHPGHQLPGPSAPRPSLRDALGPRIASAPGPQHPRHRFASGVGPRVASADPSDRSLRSRSDGTPAGPRDGPGVSGRRLAVPVLAHASLDEMQHLAAALDNAPRYLDGSVAAYFGRHFERCKADDGHAGPKRVLPLVLGVLDAIQKHARDVRPQVRRSLLAVGADGAEFAGWLFRDLHDPVSAAYWYDRAMEWAQEAQHAPMQAYMLMKKSQMAYDDRDVARVLTLAEAAHCMARKLPAAVHAEVLQQEALGLAMFGAPMDAVERKLDDARRMLSDAPDGTDDGEVLGGHFTDATLQLRAASVYTEAGKPEQAAAIFADVLATGTLSRRDTGFFGARRAAALALSGQPDDAAAVALDAVSVAKATDSERTLNVLADVVRALEPWSTRPGARTLREAMSA